MKLLTPLLLLALFSDQLFVVCAQESAPEELICFLFFALLVGAFFTYVLSQYAPDLPYTVVIFIFGAALIWMFSPVYGTDVMKRSIEGWNGISPDLLLFIFLPALLFGEAMSLNFHHVRSTILSATLLAGPGALIGAFAIATLVKYILPYDWSWGLCLLFGAITCATDPVSVVALLKKCGASSRLTYMITGEALINDGTALVIYNLFYTLIRSTGENTFTAAEVAVYFLRVIFISPLLGFAFGFGTVFVLQCTHHRMKEEDTIVQVAMTLSCAYLSFFVAEYMIGVSGVICCCAAGIILCRFAKPLFLQPETIHAIWATSEWIGNTLIFILAGIIIGARSIVHVNGVDWGYLIMLYVLLTVVRAFVIALHYPFIKYLNPGHSIAEAMFMTWGGLRGAVSMALALSLTQSTDSGQTTITEEDAHRIFFFIGGIASLTLLLNATTASSFLNYLGLGNDTSTTIEAKIIFQYMRKRMKLKALKLLHGIQAHADDSVFYVDVNIVMKYCRIFREEADQDGITLPSLPPILQEEATQEEKKRSLTFSSISKPPVVGKPDLQPEEEKRTPRSESGKMSPIPRNGLPPLHPPSSQLQSQPHLSHRPPLHREGSYHDVVSEHLQLIRDVEQTRRRARTNTITTIGTNAGSARETNDTTAATKKLVPISEILIAEEESEEVAVPSFIVPPLLHHNTTEDDTIGIELTRRSTTALLRPMHRLSPTHVASQSQQLHPSLHHDRPAHFLPSNHTNAHVNYTPFFRKTIMVELLYQIRRAFLDVVRVNYWRQIHSGKLPRDSAATLILLNSVDYGLETIHTPGLQDWEYIENTCHHLLPSSKEEERRKSRTASDISAKQPQKRRHSWLEWVEAWLTRLCCFCCCCCYGWSGKNREQEDGGEVGKKVNDDAESGAVKAADDNGGQLRGIKANYEVLIEDSCADNLSVRSNVSFSNNHINSSATHMNSLPSTFSRHHHSHNHPHLVTSTPLSDHIRSILQDHHSSQIIYTLIAFIEAHEYAQRKIPFYLGDTEMIDTIEEAIVVQESVELVEQVKALLQQMDQGLLIRQVSKQTAYWILHLQQDQIAEFVAEGIITEKDAELLYEEIEEDLMHIRFADDEEVGTAPEGTEGKGQKWVYFDRLFNGLIVMVWHVGHAIYSTGSSLLSGQNIQQFFVSKS